MKIELLGAVPSQKNRKIISMNSRTGRPFLRTDPKVKLWQEAAAIQLNQYKGTADEPVSLLIELWNKDMRARDIDNQASTLTDALVRAGLLSDDNCFVLRELHIVFRGIDKLNPRAELTFSTVSQGL